MESRTEKTRGDGLDTFRKWLTPLLIVVTGWLVGKKMDDIDKKLDMVNIIQAAQAVLNNDMINTKDRINKVESRVDNIEKTDNDALYHEAEKRLRRK